MTNREENIDEILAEIMCETMTDTRLQSWGIMVEKSDTQYVRECRVSEWLQSEYKEPEIEYVGVTNYVPRFTVIEVRNRDIDSWEKRYFLAKLENGEHYITTTLDLESYNIYNQARVRKDWDKCKE